MKGERRGVMGRGFQVMQPEPGGLLRLGEHGLLVEQGAHAVEGASAGRMPPAEATDATEARGQDVLEEPAEELERLQIDVLPLAGGAAAT